MRQLPMCLLGALLLSPLVTSHSSAQEDFDGSTTSSRTFRPVVRGTQYAAASMKQEATRAAARILESGGNAFDAIVAGQAVLALVNPESNGLGADAVILVYHAGDKKVYSINAEGTAPKLATIDWYNKNNGGKIPNSDGLLCASLPGVIDAWYILLDRWGTMTFAQVLTPVSVNYRGYEVYKNPSSSQGPAELFLLNILEGYDVKKLGHNSAEYIHTSAEALKLAFADRELLGDTDFVKIPYEGLLSKAYAAERRKLIDPNQASLEIRPGHPEQFMKVTAAPAHIGHTHVGQADYSEGDTSYIAVV